MASDFTRIKKRVTEILNANDAGTYSATLSSRNKTRNATAIEDACYEAGLKVIQFLASFPNEFRQPFIETVVIENGDLLPDHLGVPAFVEIQKYDGADWVQGDQKDYHKIESYRVNESNIYDDLNHDEEGSALSGFYDVSEGKFYFTGFAARIGLAQAVRADVLTKIPDFFENTVIKLAVGNCLKAGEGAVLIGIANIYTTAAENDLMAFRNGSRSLPPVPEAEAVANPHQ